MIIFFRNVNESESTEEENDETEDIDVTGIDLPNNPNCSQLDFDMFAMSQSILDYVKQQEELESGTVPENPPNDNLQEFFPDLPETPPETPKKQDKEELIFTSFPSRLKLHVAKFFEFQSDGFVDHGLNFPNSSKSISSN